MADTAVSPLVNKSDMEQGRDLLAVAIEQMSPDASTVFKFALLAIAVDVCEGNLAAALVKLRTAVEGHGLINS